MRLKVDGKIISAPIRTILETIKRECPIPILHDIKEKGGDKNILVTCPFHKDGRESHPSCQVYCDEDSLNVPYGYVHCFTCGYKASLPKFAADCFGEDIKFGRQWLAERFGSILVQDRFYLPEISLDSTTSSPSKGLSEEALAQYDYYHPYMWQRGLTKEVVDKFRVGYDPKRDAITFPVWDERGVPVFVTARSVREKRFYIPKNADKPIYLLNFIKQWGIQTVYVAESQINTLVLWSWGYPAVGCFGTGSASQMEILKRSGIRNYILCLDGDPAGDRGIERFKAAMSDDVLISVKKMPRGQDVADLTKEEFDSLEIL